MPPPKQPKRQQARLVAMDQEITLITEQIAVKKEQLANLKESRKSLKAQLAKK